MTKEQNAKRQREFQEKRKARNAAAFKWIMKQMRSEKGIRSAKQGLRRILKHADATPAQLLRASELLIYIATGEKKVGKESLVPPLKISAPSVTIEEPQGPEISPSDADPSIRELMLKMSQD
jgi:hypothetical protein